MMKRTTFPWMALIVLLNVLNVAGTTASSAEPAQVKIGSYLAGAWPGIATIVDDQAAFLCRVGWVDSDGVHRDTGLCLYDRAGSKPYLPWIAQSRRVWVGPSAPDGSISTVGWQVNAGKLELQWGRVGDSAVVGKVTATAPMRITLEATPSWESFDSTYRLSERGFVGEAKLKNGDPVRYAFTADRAPDRKICVQTAIDREKYIENLKKAIDAAGAFAARDEDHTEPAGNIVMLVYDLRPGESVRFSAGIGNVPSPAEADAALQRAKAAYQGVRLSSSGTWGNFLQAIANSMNSVRLYNWRDKSLTYAVSRGWSNYDGAVNFNWDTMFCALLGALEDKHMAHESIRSLYRGQLENGLLPNYYGPRWGVSTGRSQRPVNALCVWKIHQRWPDNAFLAEMYPKMVKAHNWWFATRPENGLPYRDGDRDGILACGDEGGDPGAAMFGGLDNATQWDEVIHDKDLRHFRYDFVDISGLWGADAHYLALIADTLGKTKDAETFREQQRKINEALNRLCWSDRAGMYCYRFLDVGSIMPCIVVPAVCLLTPDGKSGIKGEYFKGANFDVLATTRIDRKIEFRGGQMPIDKLGDGAYTVRWTGKLKPTESGQYLLGCIANLGVRIWLNGRLVLDGWEGGKNDRQVNPLWRQRGQSSVTPIALDAGKEYDLKVEYLHPGGPNEMVLTWHRLSDEKGGLLSNRIGGPNLYPLLSGAADKEQGKKAIAYLTNPATLWGEYVVPTISRDDPTFNEMEYWRGRIWGPTSYLAYESIKAYAPDEVRREYARKCVKLFMNNWNNNGASWENYNCNGEGGNAPHYVWGALLNLVALEEIVDIEDDGRVRLNGTFEENLDLRNIPIHGRLYDVQVRKGITRLLKNGKVVAEARGNIERLSIL